MLDLTGQKYGFLTAIRPVGKNKDGLIIWEFQCDCGNKCEKVGSLVKRGNSISCGCQKSKGVSLDLTGKKFGMLTGIRPTGERIRGLIIWEFQCDCGNLCEAPGAAVKSGNTSSCGCQKAKGLKAHSLVPSIVGERFGLLTAIENLGYQEYYNTGNRRRKALCQCDCGNIIEVWDNQLKTGAKTSCGCQYSRGETTIKNLLMEHQILFKQEFIFEDLYQHKKGHFRFDFAIFNTDGSLSHLIEFHGRQHYQETNGTWTQADSLEDRQLRDKLKEKYCQEHNITLIIIPYDQIGKITIEQLLGKEY